METGIAALAWIIVILIIVFYFKLLSFIMYRIIIKPIFKYSSRVPFLLHLLFFIVSFGIPYLFILSRWQSKKQSKIFNDVINNTSDKTVNELLNYANHISVQNHPDSWAQLRGVWNVINHSPNVTTDLKRKVLAIFMSKGLYVGNTNVIDNYKK